MAIYGHEITHRMQELAPKEYRAFREIVAEKEQGSVQKRIDAYAAQDVELTREQALDEVAADYAGRMIDDGKVLDDFIAAHKDDRTLLQKVRDAIRAILDKLTGAEKKKAESAEAKLTAALEAAVERAKILQAQSDDGTMAAKYSLKGKYWRPNLSSEEWNLLTRKMNQEIGSADRFLDKYTKWTYATEKGKTVFALYGIGDSTEATPLYAVGGKKAAAAYEVLQDWMEGKNGKTDRTRRSLDRVFGNIKRKSRSAGNGIYSAERGTATNGNVRVSVEERGRNGRGNSGTGTKDRNGGNARYSLKTDSTGRELTEAQREYFRDSKARDADGRLLTLYHQTEGLFTVFDPRHQGAGSRDNATPFGIFLKTSDRDIGLKGEFQMELYANITNPLYASNREALTYSLLKLSDEYATIKAKIDTLDATYNEKFERAKQKLRDFMTEWRSKNPEASRRALYDVPEFNALYEAEDAVVDEWTQKENQLSTQAKNAITAALRNAGYDGVILSTDSGSFGRSTDAYIALDPEQVKNASNQNPTSDPDIRYSLKAGTESKSYAALQEENQLLREQMKDYMQLQRRSSTLEESRDYWRGQTQRTRRVTTDKKAVAAAAKSFIKEYSSDLEVADIQEDLQRLYDYIASGYDGKDELTYPEARRRAEKIAEKLVTNAVEADTELYNQYSDLRRYLRSTKIVFGKEYQSQIADYSDFRKAQFGRLNLGSEGATNVDQVYQELSENWPEFFNDYCGSFCAVRSFTTSPATISPAVAGTKALLPGTCRRCVHFRAVPGGQMQCVRQLMDRSSSGVMGGSFE